MGFPVAGPLQRRFYKSRTWKKVVQPSYMRSEVFLPDGRVVPPYMCERCFLRGELRPAKFVHHIVELNEENVGDPKVATDPSNLMRVCRDCHAELHSRASGYTPRVAFDEQGRVVPLG